MKNNILINSFLLSVLTMNTISYANDVDNDNIMDLTNSVYDTLNSEKNDIESKKYTTLSNIPNIDNGKILKALNSLSNERTINANNYDPALSKIKMEFELNYKPRISAYSSGNGIDDFSYEIFYKIVNKYHSNTIKSVNYISLKNNTTLITNDKSEIIYFKLYLKYSTDQHYESRQTLVKEIEKTGKTITKEQLDSINKRYSPVLRFDQGIDIVMETIHFSEVLNMPKTINIWVKNANELYPCYLSKNQNTSTRSGVGRDYVIKYYCPQLPNLNDYGKELKILFD